MIVIIYIGGVIFSLYIANYLLEIERRERLIFL
jgi:hypothetical protein